MPEFFTHHGVFLSLFGKGVLLRGASGCGKSECALALLDRGHYLIADDAPEFYVNGNQVVGRCSCSLQNLLEVRGLGIVDVCQIFGPEIVILENTLDLILDLKTEDPPPSFDRPLTPKLDNEIILGTPVPRLTLIQNFSKNLAILVETAVRLTFSPISPRVEQLLNP
jgi:HPr kinase/phosphorylase